jgi:hypothetical protein
LRLINTVANSCPDSYLDGAFAANYYLFARIEKILVLFGVPIAIEMVLWWQIKT